MHSSSASPWPSPYPASSSLPSGVRPSPARSSLLQRFFRRPFPPPSPAKHIKASLAKRQGPAKTKRKGRSQRTAARRISNKSFAVKYDFRKEVGRGHFSHTCSARARKGEIKGQLVAVKIISTAKPCNRRR